MWLSPGCRRSPGRGCCSSCCTWRWAPWRPARPRSRRRSTSTGASRSRDGWPCCCSSCWPASSSRVGACARIWRGRCAHADHREAGRPPLRAADDADGALRSRGNHAGEPLDPQDRQGPRDPLLHARPRLRRAGVPAGRPAGVRPGPAHDRRRLIPPPITHPEGRCSMQEVSTFRLYALRGTYLLIAVAMGLQIWPLILSHPVDVEHMKGVVRAMLGGLTLLCALLGLRYPLKMLPVLFFELAWKAIWVLSFGIPLWSAGRLDAGTADTLRACLLGVVLC